ncbi:hypothetical protein O9992_00910 [Vibrio lentus]|nr:hypothetical protein [Vibrio lentus]
MALLDPHYCIDSRLRRHQALYLNFRLAKAIDPEACALAASNATVEQTQSS